MWRQYRRQTKKMAAKISESNGLYQQRSVNSGMKMAGEKKASMASMAT